MKIDAMVAATALCLSTAATVVVAPAAHGDDVLTTITATSSSDEVCPLRRVGRHLVRCDDLTGAGVPAPTWVPEL